MFILTLVKTRASIRHSFNITKRIDIVSLIFRDGAYVGRFIMIEADIYEFQGPFTSRRSYVSHRSGFTDYIYLMQFHGLG